MVRGALSDAVGYSWLLFPSRADTDGAVSAGLGNTAPYASDRRGSARSCCGAARLHTGARIRVGRTWQPAVSAEVGYTGPANPQSSDTFGAVSAQRAATAALCCRGARSATRARGSAAEARGYTGFRSFARDGRLRCHHLGSPTDLPPQNYGTWCPGGGPTYPPRITEHGAGNQRNHSGNQVK
jgi:hypothetical protein